MDARERENRRMIDGSYSALERFAEWYQENNQFDSKLKNVKLHIFLYLKIKI